MNHMLASLERLVMASRRERDETENSKGIDFKQPRLHVLVCHC